MWNSSFTYITLLKRGSWVLLTTSILMSFPDCPECGKRVIASPGEGVFCRNRDCRQSPRFVQPARPASSPADEGHGGKVPGWALPDDDLSDHESVSTEGESSSLESRLYMPVVAESDGEASLSKALATDVLEPGDIARLDAVCVQVRKIHARPAATSLATQRRRDNEAQNLLFGDQVRSPAEFDYVMKEFRTILGGEEPTADDFEPPPTEPTEKPETVIGNEVPALEDPAAHNMTYAQALLELSKCKYRLQERAFLFHMGDTEETVALALASSGVALAPRLVLLTHWQDRRACIQRFIDLKLPLKFQEAAPEDMRFTPPPRASKRKAPVRRYQKLNVPSSVTTPSDDPAARQRQEYADLIRHMIVEARDYAAALNLPCFPLLPASATSAEIATVYGQAISARKGGGRVELSSLKQRWSRIMRFFQAALDHGSIDVLMVCYFIDTANYSGFANLLGWAGRAFGISLFRELGEDDILRSRVPANKDGVTKPPTSTKHAPWLPDEFVQYLADVCATAPSPEIRRKAYFLYLCAVGGVRYADAQHVIEVTIVGEGVASLVLFTASRFKASRRNKTEQFVVPLIDYRGRSMHKALLELKDQMGPGYLLASAADNGDLLSDVKLPKARCSYNASTRLLRLFLDHWQQGLPQDHYHKSKDFSRCTIHSFKGWLDTLCHQARVPADDIDKLLHWSKGQMRARYERYPEVTEIFLRQRIVALLASDFRSTTLGDQQRTTDIPVFDTLPPVQPCQDDTPHAASFVWRF